MKDLMQVIDESLATMLNLTEQRNYAGCSGICADMITISLLSDFADGVMVGEVLQSIFDQMTSIMRIYEVSQEDQNTLKEHLKEQIRIIAKSYRQQDKGVVYEALGKCRLAATGFQFKAWRTMKPKPEAARMPGVVGRRVG